MGLSEWIVTSVAHIDDLGLWDPLVSVGIDDCKSLAVSLGWSSLVSLEPKECSSVTVILGRNPVVSLAEDRLHRPPRLPLCPGFLPEEEGIPSVAASSIKEMEEMVAEVLTPNAFDNGIFWNSFNFLSFFSFDIPGHFSAGIISRRHSGRIL